MSIDPAQAIPSVTIVQYPHLFHKNASDQQKAELVGIHRGGPRQLRTKVTPRSGIKSQVPIISSPDSSFAPVITDWVEIESLLNSVPQYIDRTL